MSTRMTGQAAARAKARQRRIELDAERVARDQRVEDAATSFYVAAEQRDAKLRELAEVEQAMGLHLAAMRAEDEDVDRIAALCDLPTSEVRRLLRAATSSRADSPERIGVGGRVVGKTRPGLTVPIAS